MEQLKASFLGKMSVLKKKVSWCVWHPVISFLTYLQPQIKNANLILTYKSAHLNHKADKLTH